MTGPGPAWPTLTEPGIPRGRMTFVYLGRPEQLRKGIFPSVMLRDPARFDSYMAVNGVPPKGGYVPAKDPATERILATRHKRDQAQGWQ